MSTRRYLHREFVLHPVSGAVASDGVQLSTVATVGTTAVTVFSAKIDPACHLDLKELEVGLTYRFTPLSAALAGSLVTYWQLQSDYNKMNSAGPTNFVGGNINVAGTLSFNVATLAAGTYSEHTYSGYIPIGSCPGAPLTLSLIALGVTAAIVTGRVKSSSYIRMIGAVIPGV